MSERRKKKTSTSAELQKLVEALPPLTWDEVQQIRKLLRSEAKQAALAQIIQAMPETSASSDSAPSFQAAAFLSTFLPSNGTELALSRLMVAATNAAMDCFARANTEDPPVRDLELNHGAKLALVTAALSKALDHHRGSEREEFIDDTLPAPKRSQKRLAATSSESRGAQSNAKGDHSSNPKGDSSTKKKT